MKNNYQLALNGGKKLITQKFKRFNTYDQTEVVAANKVIKSGILSAAKNKERPARISTIAVKRKNFLIIFCLI